MGFIDEILGEKILKLLRNRSSVFQMLPGHRAWNSKLWLTYTSAEVCFLFKMC